MNKLSLEAFFFLLASKFTTAVFVHEPSFIPVHPGHENHSDFGFTMAFQQTKNNLIVGAPTENPQGKVYACDMGQLRDPLHNEIICRNVLSSPECKHRRFCRQPWYMGVSISATSDNFLTCAPLWTNNVLGAYGTCYIFDQNKNKSLKYSGTFEQYDREHRNGRGKNIAKSTYVGGTGWTTLADEDNGLFIISKSSWIGDIVYTPIKTYQDNTKSMVRMKALNKIDKFYNLGYGLVAGKFFSNETVYAVSMMNGSMYGFIEFLGYNSRTQQLYVLNNFTIETVATMFGSMLTAEDLNKDGFSDLLVSAPVYSEEDCVECGSLHIYFGGKMATMTENIRIIGNKEFGRFSTAVATRDIDGDSIPEIAVSAPYEDGGVGAVYIISGYELLKKLNPSESYVQLQLGELKHTQRMQNKNFKTLGYSLQFVNDVDGNGVSELVAGSPVNGTAVLFKGLQTINVTLSIVNPEIVREQDDNFTARVCATVHYSRAHSEIYANLTVSNSIIGDAAVIRNPEYVESISCIDCPAIQKYCRNVTVDLKDNEPRDYKFESKAELRTEHVISSKQFFNTWAVVSPQYSEMYKHKYISRHCKDDDCIIKLSMDLLWTGSKDNYVMGSSASENVTIRVYNDGNSSYEACVWVQVNGAPLSLVQCGDYNHGYRCYLQKPLGRHETQFIPLLLNMTAPTNINKELVVSAILYERCDQESDVTSIHNITIPYVMPTDGVYINGTSHSRNFTEKEILGDAASFITDDQEYLIWNDGSITWKYVTVEMSMKKQPFINAFRVSADEKECIENHTDVEFSFICNLTLQSNSSQRIIATAVILKYVVPNINKKMGGKFNTTSEIKLHLTPTDVVKNASLTTEMMFLKELTWAHDKTMIGAIAGISGLIILIVIIIVLYKCGFFKRKQKQNLKVFKESFRQRSIRRKSHATSSAPDGQGLDMDVVEDPFEDIPIPPNTNVIEMKEGKGPCY